MQRLSLSAALLSLVLGLSCTPKPAYVSTHNVRYYSDDFAWAPSDIEAQESGFIAEFEKLKGVKADILSEAFVILHPKEYDIQCPDKPCNGYQDGKYLVVRDLGAPAVSALTHEMAHYLQWALFGIDDYEHADTELWNIADRQYQ